jgi:hypothetical protein
VVVTSPATLNPGSYALAVTNTTTNQTGTFVITLGAIGLTGPAGPEGPTGPQGPAGPLGPGGVNGVQEFFASGTFTVPANITHVMVEMWGGGGGGATFGAGGGGAYTRTVVNVNPGATYTVIVGAGGVGSSNASNGSNGGETEFTDVSSNILAFAGGGQGGAGQAPETEGAGGIADPTAMISHPGYPICNSTTVECAQGPIGGGAVFIAVPSRNPANPSPSFTLGVGGAESAGSNGGPGYALLTW